MDSGSDYTTSPSHRGAHRSSLARAIAERRITASATYIPDYHPAKYLPPIPELPSLHEPHTRQSHDARHSTPAQATPSTAYSPSPPQPYYRHSAAGALGHSTDHHRTRADAAPAHSASAPTEQLYTADMPPVPDATACVMLYLTIGGPPFYTPRAPGRAFSPGAFHRAWASVTFRPAHERAALRAAGRWDPFAQALAARRTLSEGQVHDTDLRGVAVAVPLRMDHEAFWRYLRTLYSDRVCSAHYVLQWALECPVCGDEVVGYASDPLWRGRYIYHRENDCIAGGESRRAQRSVHL
ncbi:hypothetical protein HYPSUDRAFT_209051 [Hypholoma sublateritium FD-334 SS-4]|uniref:Uncharacterized protein n=1 Tax=Hypholoma sublateritium (strain FD-334 SS-4) TaxID=945553 RepID=A0A0D2N495_HYPSF|nr:hypothetical protein HYPSUDRAFT_209051 [Hypholoma sublateritium FD-334 SS-4]